MFNSRRSFLNLLGGIAVYLPAHPSGGFDGLLGYVEGWDEIHADFVKFCPPDLFTFKNPAFWQATSPHKVERTYRVVLTHESPSRMTAAAYYRHLKSIMDWSAIDREIEGLLRRGEMVAMEYKYTGRAGIWSYDFRDEASCRAFIDSPPTPFVVKVEHMGWNENRWS